MAPKGDRIPPRTADDRGADPSGVRAHHSIGEVLSLLKPEFPDITISKIRFLESQGLLDPERTPSGYRRFYEQDIQRLRWILRQQRENFLPLKVIKGRLAEADAEGFPSADQPSVEPPPLAPPRVEGGGPPVVAEDASGRVPASRRVLPEPTLFARSDEASGARSRSGEGVSLTLEELTAATGLSRGTVGELERYGLIGHRELGSTVVYDEEALLVAKLAAWFANHGVEPRHLRMYKVAADREAGLFEQVVAPVARQRSPDARRRVSETLGELSRYGSALHAAMLRRALDKLG